MSTEHMDAETIKFNQKPGSPEFSALTGLKMGIALVAAFGLLTVGMTGCKDSSTEPAPAATTAAAPAPAAPVKLSPAEIKEMETRDTYAVNLGKELHAKVPAYKDVKIFADNYMGAKSPSKTPQMDPKTRKGDNLMLVFLSPDAGTAKGLADFTKTPAAMEAATSGFDELQFVDPNTYCFAPLDSVTGAGAVKCGPR